MKQLSFFENSDFGGKLLKGNPRSARPIQKKSALFLSFKTSTRKNLRLKDRLIRRILKKQALLHKVRIHKSLITKSSVQILIKPRSTKAYKSFVRSTTGLIARKLLKAEKGSPRGIKFWMSRPFSKLVATQDIKKSIAKDFQKIESLIAGFISKAVSKTQPRQAKEYHLSGYT